MELLHYKYLHLWFGIIMMFHPIGLPKPLKRINVSFQKRSNKIYSDYGKTTVQNAQRQYTRFKLVSF